LHDTQLLRRAIELAAENVRLARGGPFGALVVRDGVILAEGVNLVTHDHDPTAHAEIVAIRRATAQLKSFRLDGCTIYSSCEPCPMCLAAIYWARAARLVFAATREDAAAAGFDDAFLYEQLALEPGARRLPAVNLLREEAALPFNLWAQSAHRIRY
jgi:tRNA(Arg) A34 adenosine deaminase TadA